MHIENIENCLIRCWSIETSSKWTFEKPYKGQCGVTSLVINDIFGGKILKTFIDNKWHYYNWISNHRYDFTSKQFDFIPEYQDLISTRDEAFSDTNESQYKQLKKLMEKELFGIIDSTSVELYP